MNQTRTIEAMGQTEMFGQLCELEIERWAFRVETNLR